MSFVRALAAVLFACAGTASPVLAGNTAPTVVGVVGAANASPVGRAPGGSVRALVPGGNVYFHDHIVTKRGGSAQLAFLDRSTLSVSENSDLVIDEFVYKPGGAGTMSASLTKGVLRYVGGDISHNGGTTIRTPTVTIGIRGGIGLVAFVEDAAALRGLPGIPHDFHGGTVVVNGYGTLTLRNAQSEVVISKPGFAVFVGSAGEAIAAPVRVSASTAQAMMQKLTSRVGQHGGASPPSLSAAAASVEPRIASLLAQPIAVPAQPAINALDYTSAFSTGNGLARNRAQARQVAQLQTALIAQAAAAQAAATAKAATTTANTSSNGSATQGSGSGSSGSSGNASSGNGTGNSGTGGTGGSGTGTGSSGLSGTLDSHDINASTVTATVICAHEIDAQFINGTIHVVSGSGNGSGGDVSMTTVQAATIDAHDIHATTVSATNIYVQLINGN